MTRSKRFVSPPLVRAATPFERRRFLTLSLGAAVGLVGCGATRSSAFGPARGDGAPGEPEDGGHDALGNGGYDAGGRSVADGSSVIVRPDGSVRRDSGSGIRSDGGVVARPDAARPGVCHVTDENILGPYYKEGAPFRADIRAGAIGDVTIISGTVFAHDCVTPLAGATVDVWQANADGAYDNTGFTLRGRMTTGEDGRYVLTTIMPGRYLNGSQYRPAHVHYRVHHPAGVDLTTQLYFEGDPFNDVDPFIVDSLIMPVDSSALDGSLVKHVGFDIVLA